MTLILVSIPLGILAAYALHRRVMKRRVIGRIREL